MRLELAVIGILAIAGCQSQRGYTAGCPHCNQPQMVNNQAVAPSVNTATFNDADSPAPMPKNYATALQPVPSVPGVE